MMTVMMMITTIIMTMVIIVLYKKFIRQHKYITLHSDWHLDNLFGILWRNLSYDKNDMVFGERQHPSANTSIKSVQLLRR